MRLLENSMARHSISIGLVLALACGSTTKLFAQARDETAVSIYASIVQPKNLSDLFRNMKTAMDGALLLRRDFYTDDNLKKFVGGAEVRWTDREPARLKGFVDNLEAVIKPEVFSGRSIGRITVFFTRDTDGHQIVSGVISIDLTRGSDEAPDFSEVERLFGRQWADQEYVLPSPHQIPKESTDAHGNQRIIYETVEVGVHREIRFNFSYDGRVQSASFFAQGVAP